MARTVLTVSEVVRAGLTQPATQNSDHTNGNYIVSTDADDCWWFEANNTSGATRTITVTANPNLSSDGLTVSNYTVTVAAGATKLCGPFRFSTFKQPSDSNKVYIDTDGADADVTYRLYKITPAN